VYQVPKVMRRVLLETPAHQQFWRFFMQRARFSIYAFASALLLTGISNATSREPEVTGLTADEVWAKLQIGNRRFVSGQPMHHDLPENRAEIARGQRPWVIVLGCSDSSVSPELIFDQTLGDMFVVRTAGNIADPVALGSIEYALQNLHPTALVILGHEKCSVVRAAASGERMPTANLEAVVSKIQPALASLRSVVTGEELVRRGAEENVRHCAGDILRDSEIVRSHVEQHELTIMKALYDLDTGVVARLD
jgi:carbonic anhydrase